MPNLYTATRLAALVDDDVAEDDVDGSQSSSSDAEQAGLLPSCFDCEITIPKKRG